MLLLCTDLHERAIVGQDAAGRRATLRHYTVEQSLWPFYHRNQQSFHIHLGLEEFKRRYAGGGPLAGAFSFGLSSSSCTAMSTCLTLVDARHSWPSLNWPSYTTPSEARCRRPCPAPAPHRLSATRA